MRAEHSKQTMRPDVCASPPALDVAEVAALGRAERRVVRALARGLAGPEPKAAARALGLPPVTLYQQVDDTCTRRLTLEVAHALQARAGRWPVYEALARLSGHLLVPRPVAAPEADCLLRASTVVTREVGEAAGALLLAVDPAGPGGTRMTPAERAHTLAEIDDAMTALAAKRELLQRMEAGAWAE